VKRGVGGRGEVPENRGSIKRAKGGNGLRGRRGRRLGEGGWFFEGGERLYGTPFSGRSGMGANSMSGAFRGGWNYLIDMERGGGERGKAEGMGAWPNAAEK